MTDTTKSPGGVQRFGILQPGRIFANLAVPHLVEEAVAAR